MARIALRIWSAIISTFAVMAVHSPANSAVAEASADLGVITAQRSKKPELFLEKASTSAEQNIKVAAHRSHSSHRSHASHASGYGARRPSTTEPSTTSSTSDEPASTSNNIAPSKNTNRAAPPAPKSSTNSDPSSSSGSDVKKLHLSIGSSLDCDYAWQEGDKVNVLTNGKVLRFDASEVDIQKTFNKK